jgi:hypothetical protein
MWRKAGWAAVAVVVALIAAYAALVAWQGHVAGLITSYSQVERCYAETIDRQSGGATAVTEDLDCARLPVPGPVGGP